MKAIILSDIHGCYKYMLKVEELINKVAPGKIILLGDLLYYGARNELPEEYNTAKVYELLNKHSDIIVAVRGNCDSEVDNTVTDFDLSSDYKIIDLDGIDFVLTHGHFNPWLMDIIKDKYVLQGHTHVYNLSGKVINPGSVGIPRGSNLHTCILYENRNMKLIDLDNFNIIDEINIK